MKSKAVFFLVFALLAGQLGMAQFNPYKYIIVPKNFDAFKKPNQHQTSTLIKHMLTQKGFNVVYDDAMPPELYNNRCLGLLTAIEDSSGLFATKVSIVFKDCKSQEVFRTIEGRSKIKEYRAAYKEAIQRAFVSLDGIQYTYEPSEAKREAQQEEPLTISFRDDVKHLEEKKPVSVIEQVATQENQTYKNLEPTPSEYVKGENKSESFRELLYAQPTENGFQLVDSTPAIKFRIVRSSFDDIYLVDGNTKNGIVFQKEGSWWLEKVVDGKRILQKLNIKF